jgi:hypothetical protein
MLYRASGVANPVQDGIGSDLFPDAAGVLLGYARKEKRALIRGPHASGREERAHPSAREGRGEGDAPRPSWLACELGWAACGGKQAGRGWLRCSFPFLLFFLFYFSKPFSNRILNTINFNPKSHDSNKNMPQHECKFMFLNL